MNNTEPIKQTISTLKNIFNNKDKLEIELSLDAPIKLNLDDVLPFVNLFYEKNTHPELILLFTPEVSIEGGITVEFYPKPDVATNIDYIYTIDINISNEHKYYFSFFLAENKTNSIHQDIELYFSTKDFHFFVDTFLYEYQRMKKVFTLMLESNS